MKTIVVTGGTLGIGFGMADVFLARGAQVMICGRSEGSVQKAVGQLAEKHTPERVHGIACDVGAIDQIEALWDATIARFGKVDIWINNAGISTPNTPFWEQPPEKINAVVQTNLIGSMLASRVAIARMNAQGFGALYNMEGFGSDGRKMPGMTLYGTTKAAIRYLSQSLIKETKELPVIVGILSPGMVVTRMLVGEYDRNSQEWHKLKKLFNILADKPETVCPWLAERILENQTHGAAFRWLTTPGIIGRFLLAPFRKRDLFDDE